MYILYYVYQCEDLVIVQRVGVLLESAIERVLAESGRVTNDEQLHSCTSDGHVHATKVGQESHLSLSIVAHHGDEDYVAFLPLKTINGIDGNQLAEGFPVGVLAHHTSE